MSDVPLETCWAFNVLWNNKFRYQVASCWLLLLSHTTMHGSMNIIFTKVFHCMTLRQTDVKGWTSLCRLGFTDIFAATFGENFVEWCTTIIRFLLDTLIVTLKRIETCRVNSTQFDSTTVVRTTRRHVVSSDKHGNGPTDMECNCRRTGLEVIRMNHALYIILRLLLADFIFSNFIQN